MYNRPNLGTSSFNCSHKPKIKEKLNRYVRCAHHRPLASQLPATLFFFSALAATPQSRETNNNYLFLLLNIITNCFYSFHSICFSFSFVAFLIFVRLLLLLLTFINNVNFIGTFNCHTY